jgi:hypothetical protein
MAISERPADNRSRLVGEETFSSASVGIDHDTANYAVNSIRRWWQIMGRERHLAADTLLITADGRRSNCSCVRLLKRGSCSFWPITGDQVHCLQPATRREQLEQAQAPPIL